MGFSFLNLGDVASFKLDFPYPGNIAVLNSCLDVLYRAEYPAEHWLCVCACTSLARK